VTTASPSMPWIFSILDFCNARIYIGNFDD
jgi:hypothetical protein